VHRNDTRRVKVLLRAPCFGLVLVGLFAFPGRAYADGDPLALASRHEPAAEDAAPEPGSDGLAEGAATEPAAPPADPPADAGSETPTDAPATAPPPTDPATSSAPPPVDEPEGPDDEYASSKDAGTAMSGEAKEGDELPQDKQTVGNVKKKPKSLSHKGTGMIGVAGGFGYGLRTAGDKYCGEFSSDPGDADGRKAVCTGLAPAFLDLTLGYGAADRIDVVLGVRVNLQKRQYDDSKCGGADTCTDGKGLFVDGRGIGILPGIRIWGSEPDKIFKLGGAVDFFYMYENFDGYRNRPLGPNNTEDPADRQANRDDEAAVSDHFIGMRGGPIIQVDPHHNVGIFFIPAAVPGFRPKQADGKDRDAGWFELAFDLSLGIQARFP